MRTTRSTGIFAFLIAGALAVSATGCVVDNGNPGPGVCYPDLYVNWQVTAVVNGVDTPITCASAGAASVTGQVAGFSDQVVCPAGASAGSPLLFQLDQSGYYSANVQLRDVNGTVLSQTAAGGTPAIYVDCSGNTQTPVISLSIN